LVKSLAFEARN